MSNCLERWDRILVIGGVRAKEYFKLMRTSNNQIVSALYTFIEGFVGSRATTKKVMLANEKPLLRGYF